MQQNHFFVINYVNKLQMNFHYGINKYKFLLKIWIKLKGYICKNLSI